MGSGVIPDLNIRQVWRRIGRDGDFYLIIRDPDTQRKWSCSCKGWVFRHRKSREFECKHIRDIKRKLVDIL